MTSTRFRLLIAAWVVVTVWWWSMPLGAYKQSAVVQAAMEHTGKGAIIPPGDTVAYLFLFTTLASAIGLAFYQSWARRLLTISTVASVALSPLMGVAVSGPFDTTMGYVGALLNGAVLAIAMSEPISRLFLPQSHPVVVEDEVVTVFETTDATQVPAFQLLLRDAGIPATATLAVRRSDAIVAKDVIELAGN